jgi:hypothetical protein
MPVIPGLSRSEADSYVSALMAPGARTHRRATVMNLNHGEKRSLHHILGGQVRWNSNGDVRTEASVTFSDFDDQIDLDIRHLVRLEMGVETQSGNTLWAPLTTGWVQACNDTGYETEVTIHGKEKFGLRASDRGRAKRGERVGEVIWRMHHQIGERHSIIPDHLRESGPKIAEAVEWGGGKPEKCVTKMSRRLAKRAGLQVLYDQLGRLDLRPIPDQPRISFTETKKDKDVEVRLLGPITFDEDFSELCNRVIGAGRRDLRAISRARGKFSPPDLVRGGVPLWLTHRFSDDTLDSQDELGNVTQLMAGRMSIARAQVQVTSTPAPWLLPEDRLHAEKRNGKQANFWMGTGSIELDGSSMAIGYQQVTYRARGVRTETSGRGYTAKEIRERRKRQAKKNGKGKP